MELKSLFVKEILQRSMKFAAEDFAEDPDWQKEAGLWMNPARLIG